MRESVRLIRAALTSKGYTPICASNSDILTWYTRLGDAGTPASVVLLQEYPGGEGYELFVQATSSNSVDKTIEAIP